jgi:hypothetical protein
MPDPSGPGGALGAGRPPAGRMTRAGRPAASGLCSGTVAHLGRGPGDPDMAWNWSRLTCARVSGISDPSAYSSGPARAHRSARVSPPRSSTRRRILDGLGHQLGQLGPDGQPVADLREDLGGIPPCPGRVVQPTSEAVGAGLGQVGSQAVREAVDDGLDDVHR